MPDRNKERISLVNARRLFDRREWAHEIPAAIEFEFHSRLDFEDRIRFYPGAHVLGDTNASQLHGVANPPISDRLQVEFTDSRRNPFDTLLVARKVNRSPDRGGRIGSQRIDRGGLPIDAIYQAIG